MNSSIPHSPIAIRSTSSPPILEGEFWTSKQRQASSLHEVSYRACFKPQLPRYFIERYSSPGDLVYDPFMGRGTTVIEAALLGRRVAGNDANPLATIFTLPRLELPEPSEVEERLGTIAFGLKRRAEIDLSMFYHEKTEAEIVSLKDYLSGRRNGGNEDAVDRWIRMVATNRLTGHSPGFFSVYTLPPNQATLPQYQEKINRLRGQKPEYRDTKKIILRKTKTLFKKLSDVERRNLRFAAPGARLLVRDARSTPGIEDRSVRLSVTSPPFLDVVHYAQDNWLRCWFNEIDSSRVEMTMTHSLDEWSAVMAEVFAELFRITADGGFVAFEVGEVRKGSIRLEEAVIPLGRSAGFDCNTVLINLQSFTKTANIWGIGNNRAGTNTNRIVLFQKPNATRE